MGCVSADIWLSNLWSNNEHSPADNHDLTVLMPYGVYVCTFPLTTFDLESLATMSLKIRSDLIKIQGGEPVLVVQRRYGEYLSISRRSPCIWTISKQNWKAYALSSTTPILSCRLIVSMCSVSMYVAPLSNDSQDLKEWSRYSQHENYLAQLLYSRWRALIIRCLPSEFRWTMNGNSAISMLQHFIKEMNPSSLKPEKRRHKGYWLLEGPPSRGWSSSLDYLAISGPKLRLEKLSEFFSCQKWRVFYPWHCICSGNK